MQIEPYLFFEGRCEEAIDFYRAGLPVEVLFMMKNRESPDQGNIKPGTADKVLHATLKIGGSPVMVSDGRCSGAPNFNGFALALAADDEAQTKRLFAHLAQGGEIRFPLQKTFWSPSFGMVCDKFGVLWTVSVAG